MAERPGEVGAGVDGVVLNELEGRTMELVGSGLEGDVGDGADGAAELSLVVIGGDVDGLMASAGGMRICSRPVRSSSSMPSI